MEFHSLKKYLLEKTALLHKCRSKLVKKFGVWWFQEMPEEEWVAKREEVVINVEGIHTEKELSEFLCMQQNIRDPFDNVQYKFFVM